MFVGVFGLTDPSGLPAGDIEVTLKWKSTYFPPSVGEQPSIPNKTEQHSVEKKKEREQHSVEEKKKEREQHSVEEKKKEREQHSVEEKKKEREVAETPQKEEKHLHHQPVSLPTPAASKAPLPKLRQRNKLQDGPAAKKVTFIETSATDAQVRPLVRDLHYRRSGETLS
ncbi:putative uncharacterized protein DDB_G0271982 [Etheostoma cragini]|uniref:putative uncharacterized protein DDB_G0271982 n=1 Tax=Etheostoma cragini TaxID=417921 RepID=UPI00155EC1D8|nr:putative uncharacterized protein DDB_G0271982 [Etheostoma cragini]